MEIGGSEQAATSSTSLSMMPVYDAKYYDLPKVSMPMIFCLHFFLYLFMHSYQWEHWLEGRHAR